MLISPPFLPTRTADESEDGWLDRCMAGGAPGAGAFPVSFNLGWHGGMHLKAPRDGASFEPVRAIADGTVVFRRDPSSPPAGTLPEDHAQAYNGGWTDNGVVVIRHDTEIGEGTDASVTFFSIYMHLNAIDAAVSTTVRGGRIFRKAEIGQAGQIYGGADRRIHFEIVCNDDNLTKLVGRASGERSLDSDGRTDSVYGTMYVLLPAGTHVFAEEPLPNSAAAMIRPAPSPGHPHPTPVAVRAIHATAADIVIALRAAGGEGVVGQRGSVFVQTCRPDGSTIGAEIEEANGEYDFYTRAKAISESYPAGGRPAASAVYELLRFGRVIGPDALVPADVPCWRQIRHDGFGVGWANLNASGLRKFSDADFPQWRRWRLIDDSADQDSRCDSAVIRGWLNSGRDGLIRPHEASRRLADDDVAPKLARAICKFATEWDISRVDAQWAWLKTETPENPRPLSEEDFGRLRAHLNALQFWPGGTGLPVPHWHFQPKEFVRQFRKCGWLAAHEMTQLPPRRYGARGALTAIPWATAEHRFAGYTTDLNRAMRKYGIESATRQTHFLAQTYIETAMWATVEEYGRAHQQRRRDGTPYWPARMMEFYGPFYGRGAMQLTWAGNYEAYGAYRALPPVAAAYTYSDSRITQTSMHHFADPGSGNAPRRWAPRYDPGNIASNAFNACDSAGHYWVSKAIGGSRHNINRVCDDGVTTNAVGRVSVLVNGGGYGFAERQAYGPYIDRFRSDRTESNTDSAFVVAYGTRRHNVYVDFTPQRPR